MNQGPATPKESGELIGSAPPSSPTPTQSVVVKLSSLPPLALDERFDGVPSRIRYFYEKNGGKAGLQSLWEKARQHVKEYRLATRRQGLQQLFEKLGKDKKGAEVWALTWSGYTTMWSRSLQKQDFYRRARAFLQEHGETRDLGDIAKAVPFTLPEEITLTLPVSLVKKIQRTGGLGL